MLSKRLAHILPIIIGLLVAFQAHGQSDFEADYTYPEDLQHNWFAFSKADTARIQCNWTDAAGETRLFHFTMPASVDEHGVMAVLQDLKSNSQAPQNIQTDPVWALRLLDALAAWDSVRPFIGLVYDEATDLWYHKAVKTNQTPAAMGNEVVVHIKGYLESGRVFEDSYQRGDPVKFVLGTNKHLPALEQGITLFREGEKGTVRLPSERAFGGRGAGNLIPPGSTVYYDIELLKVYDEHR